MMHITRMVLKPLALALSIALLAGACTSETATTAVDDGVTAAVPTGYSAAFDVNDLDTSIDACQDFNAFVNAKWVAANPIPADQTRWGAFDALREQSLQAQRKLVEEAAAGIDRAMAGSIEQKIGAFYRAGMDEAAVEAAGFEPIRGELERIAALDDSAAIAAWLNEAAARGASKVFSFWARSDYKNAAEQIGFAFQGGLGLPSPEYYLEDQYAELRAAREAHLGRLFELTGVAAEDAAARAARVLAFETSLARHSVPRVEMRNPQNQYHFVSVAEANEVTPHFDWNAFLAAQGVTAERGFSLSQPGFFAEFDRLLAEAPAEDWRDYLSAHVIADAAPYLSAAFADESFAFNGKTLNGQPEQRERWKRVLSALNGAMGEALGQLYVAQHFPPQAKARAQELVDNVNAALKARIEGLEWMGAETKEKALAKWATFLPKIGYPENWRNWDGLEIVADGYFGNLAAARAFNHHYEMAKIGKPTDRQEWFMTPQTVNAYYNPSDNTINFPAAILQPPFFYADGDDGINYGGIGAVIGHEAGHGFDDQGSQFDGAGNLENWWTDADRQEFETRAEKLIAQFDAYVPLANHPDKHVKGKLTLGENIGDLGGLSFAFDALQAVLAENPELAASRIDGYSQEQRFFMNWARVWRGDVREERQLVLLNTDSHAPIKFRAIGAPANMPAFATAFGCKAGDAMVRPEEDRVHIW